MARSSQLLMTDQELQQSRREKWRLDGKPIRTIEQARTFLEDVGFCLMFPKRPPLLVPTFIGAFVGSEDRLPEWQHAFKDPRAAEATELMVRLLRERTAFEANLFDENNGFLVSASAFPYFYALVGERNPKLAPRPGSRSPYSALACDAFELITRDGPISKQKMQEVLGGSVSFPALDDALGELWSKLRITRVDYKQLHCAIQSQGCGECAAGGARVELCDGERAIDATHYAGEGCGGSSAAECRTIIFSSGFLAISHVWHF